MIKSPLRYPGGKSKAVKFLIQYFPPNFKEFREPMFGGGSITFYLVQTIRKAKFQASDINYDLYCFWITLKEKPKELVEVIKKIWNLYQPSRGKKLYQEIIERRKRENLPCFQRAVDFFILNRITFSGTVDSGGYSEQAFKKRFTLSSIERLLLAHKVVKHIEFFHKDYEFLLTLEGKDVLIYLDPPYYGNKNSALYGKRGNLHKDFDHIRLFKLVNNSPHRVIITYDNNEFIRELYRDFYIIEWDLKYGMSSFTGKGLKQGRELLIANFPLNRKMFFISQPLKAQN